MSVTSTACKVLPSVEPGGVTVRFTAALRAGGVAGVMALGVGMLGAPSPAGAAPAAAPGAWGGGRALLVGTYHGVKGQYKTIQAAVDAARPGDWILVAPGDYHENTDETLPPSQSDSQDGRFGGVLITTPDLHLRGMNRRSVVVDGTKPGASTPCTSNPSLQNFGPVGSSGTPLGRNGIVVWKANDVTIQNLTVCNFLGGAGYAGNEIWWNGGANSGRIGLHGEWGSYLTATSTFFGGESTAATYGIFSSNSSGGKWSTIYASNFNDSGMYVGACQQLCNMTITHAWMEYSALGYSGTNSGGRLVIKDSLFDHNEDGFDTNSAISGDGPGPQNGACPHHGISPITHTHSCWVFMDNVVRDNNNGKTPEAGSAAAGPTGTGMTVSGGRNDTVMDNVFKGNGAWGILFVPYPDSGKPVLGQTCAGDGGHQNPAFGCVFDPESDALVHNTFRNDGYFKNPSNSDFGQITLYGHEPQNCFVGNLAPNGSAPANLESAQPTCGPKTTSANTGGPLLGQVLCDTGFGTCPPGATYPPRHPDNPVMHKLPALPTMPNPCKGVPANPWCPGGKPL